MVFEGIFDLYTTKKSTYKTFGDRLAEKQKFFFDKIAEMMNFHITGLIKLQNFSSVASVLLKQALFTPKAKILTNQCNFNDLPMHYPHPTSPSSNLTHQTQKKICYDLRFLSFPFFMMIILIYLYFLFFCLHCQDKKN